jgi:Uma2 family endonuclease
MSTVAIQSPPITVEQYERFEGYPGLRDELINGEIFLSPQPKPLHQQIAKNINRTLDAALQGQGYTAQQNTNIRFADANSMPSPDVFVITKKDWNLACESDSYLSTPPVLVVEVLSPANRKTRIEAKIKLYLSQNVTEVWLVRPKKKTVEVIREEQRAFAQGRIVLPAPLFGWVETESFFTLD